MVNKSIFQAEFYEKLCKMFSIMTFFYYQNQVRSNIKHYQSDQLHSNFLTFRQVFQPDSNHSRAGSPWCCQSEKPQNERKLEKELIRLCMYNSKIQEQNQIFLALRYVLFRDRLDETKMTYQQFSDNPKQIALRTIIMTQQEKERRRNRRRREEGIGEGEKKRKNV